MTELQHPNITPALVIEVPADAVDAHLRAGWLLVEHPEPDPATGEDHEPSEETEV